MEKKTIAIMYDFDKTLSKKDQQEYTFIPSLGLSAEEFWGESDRLAKEYDMDRILAYMLLMIKQAKLKDIPITKEAFNELGKDVELLPGVKSWFSRVNAYGEEKGVNVEHYILSSGLREIIEGTPIAKYFKKIYACSFHYNKSGNADWPARVVNYTTKTQFIFRINKGILDLHDDKGLNSFVPEAFRSVPYDNMIYIGDGFTDVPCMKLVRSRGGEAIAVYHGKETQTAAQLINDKRVVFACRDNYSKNSMLEKTVFKLIDRMANGFELNELTNTQKEMALDNIIEEVETDE